MNGRKGLRKCCSRQLGQGCPLVFGPSTCVELYEAESWTRAGMPRKLLVRIESWPSWPHYCCIPSQAQFTMRRHQLYCFPAWGSSAWTHLVTPHHSRIQHRSLVAPASMWPILVHTAVFRWSYIWSSCDNLHRPSNTPFLARFSKAKALVFFGIDFTTRVSFTVASLPIFSHRAVHSSMSCRCLSSCTMALEPATPRSTCARASRSLASKRWNGCFRKAQSMRRLSVISRVAADVDTSAVVTPDTGLRISGQAQV